MWRLRCVVRVNFAEQSEQNLVCGRMRALPGYLVVGVVKDMVNVWGWRESCYRVCLMVMYCLTAERFPNVYRV
jgi:hypothetical protein